ncbi:MAG: nuclear transport factor 2 family protein [Pyrinomonadaceae bacterium]|jgi:uncharacterized membrane protein|nr:nuclear transport factor 2 family protein [Pyrinomonadaceae bacterium]
MKSILLMVLLALALSTSALAQTQTTQPVQKRSVEEDVLKAEREQRDALLKRDVKAMERLVADEFVLTIPGGVGNKADLLAFLRGEPADPTLTLTSEDEQGPDQWRHRDRDWQADRKKKKP